MQRRLGLSAELSLADALGVAFGAMMEEAEAQARAAVVGPADALHNYRRAVRRAQAVFALTRQMLRKRQRQQVERELRRATRRTRTLRDLDAVMPVVARLEAATANATDAAALAGLRRYLEAAVAELAGSEITAWRLRKNVRSLAGLGAIYRAGLHGWVEADMLLGSLRDRYKVARDAWKVARADGTGESLHAWRRAARGLRYALELLASRDGTAAGLAALHETFEAQVKGLGQVTDLMALAALVDDADPDALGADVAWLSERLRALAAEGAAAVFEAAEPVFAVRPKSFAWLTEPVAEASTEPSPEAAPVAVAAPSEPEPSVTP